MAGAVLQLGAHPDDEESAILALIARGCGARVVYWAAHHNRREIYVGTSSVGAIVGNKMAPGLLDKYLAKSGFQSQQTSEPEDPTRPDNLWQPLDANEDHGAHGHFDSRAHRFSV